MEWKNEALCDWVRNSSPAWAEELILNWDSIFPRDFPKVDVYDFILQASSSIGDIDFDAVVGQWEHYAGQTWRNALFLPQYKPSKMARTLAMADANPGYYFSAEPKDVFFDSIDGRSWYSHGGGNHRTVVGKFLHAMAKNKSAPPPVLLAVHKTHFQVDWHAFRTFTQLQNLIADRQLKIQISAWRIALHQEQVGTTREEISEPGFLVADYRFRSSGQAACLPAADFLKFANWVLEQEGMLTRADLARNWVNYLFGKYQGMLVYPGGKATPLKSRRAFSIARQKAWKKRFA